VGNFKPGFKGIIGTDNNTAGPDGVLTTENELWVGDAPSQVWALNPTTGAAIVPAIKTSATSPNRADELCYDPTHKIFAIVNNADSPPFITFISSVTHTVLGQVTFDGTGGTPNATDGAEQCQWNPRDGNIYLSIPEVNGQFGKRPLATVRRIFGSIVLWLAVTGMIEPTLQRKSVALAFIRVSGGETEIDKRPNRR
jgi:hypothetical protein